MNLQQIRNTLGPIFLGQRYSGLTNINDQVRYMTMNSILMVAILPLVILGITLFGLDLRYIIDFGIALICLICLILMRTNLSFRIIPIIPSAFYGAYCVYLISVGTENWWTAVWIFAFPLVAIFLCQMFMGIMQSLAVLGGAIFIMYSSVGTYMPPLIRTRIIIAYALILALTIIYERVSMLKDNKESALNAQLSHERDIVQTMKDNIHQGIFLMDSELKILSQYSKPLISILSYYDSDLEGKNFLDILASSLDAKQLQTMKGYFSMVFSKSKSAKVLESANPISEFEYNVDDRVKTLSTRFNLIERAGSESLVIGIIQDITREKEFERELQAQKEAQEQEMKNLFNVIQIDPLVFQDFIEDTDANFNYINEILKDRSLTERQVVTKLYQNVHAIKSNALILNLESFGNNLHKLEDDIKKVSNQIEIRVEDVLDLAMKLENAMQEKDSITKIVSRIDAFKSTNQIDSVLVYSLTKAVERLSAETHKRVEIKIGQLDKEILESNLRKPIKDILFQCVRNAVYHGIELPEDRINKNKKPQGLLAASIKNTDGKVEVIFSDDGRGLDWDKIKAKYLKLHPDDTAVSKNTLLATIFTPEFSTSDETTSIAGRGIGLSLVKDVVKDNKGSINVSSSESGLTFKFTFPLPAYN